MPIQPLPINGNPYLNVDEVELVNVGPYLYNCYVNELGNTVKRPGLSLFATIPDVAKVDGIIWWPTKQRMVAVAGGKPWEIKVDGTVTEISIHTDSTNSIGTGNVSWVDYGEYLAWANRSPIHYLKSGEANFWKMGDADAPTDVSFLGYLDQYILALQAGTGRFSWSDVLTVTDWTSTSFATAEGAPDNLQALHVAWSEINLIGERSIEIWVNDTTTPFIRQAGANTEAGTVAPFSTIFWKGVPYMLTETRQFIRVDGRTPVPISTPIDKVIQGYGSVSDCVGFHIPIAGQQFILWNFPSQAAAHCYNIVGDKWQGMWTTWDQARGIHTPWIGNCQTYSPLWNKHFLGSRSDGKIYVMDTSYTTDAGVEIAAIRRTGWIDHGASVRKRSNRVTFKFKMGQGTTGTSPYVSIRWRDDGAVDWEPSMMVDLEDLGNTEFHASLYGLGMYRARQYEISMTDAVPLILCGAEEELEVMSR